MKKIVSPMGQKGPYFAKSIGKFRNTRRSEEMLMSSKKLTNKVVVILVTLGLTTPSLAATANPQLDAFFTDFKIAASNGGFQNYVSVGDKYSYPDGSYVQKLSLAPAQFGGKINVVYLSFEKDGTLTSFKVNDRKSVPLNEEQRTLLSFAKNNEQAIRAFFSNPTPELRDALESLVSPVAEKVTEKVTSEFVEDGVQDNANKPKTKVMGWVQDFASDLGESSGSTFKWVDRNTTRGVKGLARLGDFTVIAVLGSWLIFETLAFPVYVHIYQIPMESIVGALPALFQGVAIHAGFLGGGTLLFRSIIRAAKRHLARLEGKDPDSKVESEKAREPLTAKNFCSRALNRIFKLWSLQ